MTESLTERREPETRASTPERREPETRAFVRARVPRVRRSRAPALPGTHDTTLLPSSVPLRVVLPSPPESSLPTSVDPLSDLARASSPTVTRFLATVVTDSMLSSPAAFALVAELVDFAAAYRLEYRASLVSDPGPACPTFVEGEVALGCDILEDRHEELECLAAAAPHLAPEGDLDALTHPHPALLQRGDLGVKRPPGSPPAFKARYIARGFSQRQGVDFFHTPKMTTLRVLLHVAAQRDYELHSLDFSTAFLQGCLHEAIWLRRPPGFTGLFPEALGFTPSTADPSLFLLTDTILPPFYVLVYVDDLVFATADTEALALVKGELQERHTCTDLSELRSYLGLQITWDRARRTITLTQSHMVHQVLQRFGFQLSSPKPTPLSTGHSLSAPPSDESVEPSGPYPELVGCLITSAMGLVLGGRGSVVLTGDSDASWADDQATQHSSQGYTFSLGSGSVSWRSTRSSSVLGSSCEGEIYAGAMAAQELRWLTYLLTDLGERHRSPPVLYVDNKAMLALCHEQRLEHRTKHIALRYFLARELQQRRQLRLSYVASRANTVGATLRPGGVGVTAGAGGTGGAGAASPGGACTRGTGAAGAGGVGGDGAGDPGAGGTGAGGAGAGVTRAGDPGAGGTGAGDPGAGGASAGSAGARGAGAGDPGAGGSGAGGTGARDPRARGAGAGGVGAGGAGAGGTGAGGAGGGGAGAGGAGAGGTGAGGAGARDPRAGGAGAGDAGAGGIGAGGTVQRQPFFVLQPPKSLPPPNSVLRQVLNSPLPAPSLYAEQTNSLTEHREPASRLASPIALFPLVVMFFVRVLLLSSALTIWYFGVDFFQTFSPTPKMTTLLVLLHVAAQRDYELQSLDFSTTFLQGSLHEEIWLRRPPGFTKSFHAGTQWSLRRPVYGLRQAPREWHDTLRMTLAALGFAPLTTDPSLFLLTDTSLLPFYFLVYVDDLVFATADTEALALVKSELQKRHTCTDLGELRSYLGLEITRDRARRTITLTQSHMVHLVLHRFGFQYSSAQSTPLPTDHLLSAPPFAVKLL
ncbi:unnamed protein product [Closterium sp. NIES-53]